jgi:pimeloyl-ACP methyl ester carboxylesterase
VADFVKLTRAGLAAVGFARHERDGLVWWEGGSGSPLVMLHGVNDQAGTWSGVAAPLAKSHRVILPDLPGHGESAPTSGPLPVSLFVDRVSELMPDEPFTLHGNSLGGWIAMLYTLRHPQNVRTLILESSGGLNRPFASAVYAHSREEAIEILRAVHGPSYVAQDWVIDALLERAHDSQMLRVTEIEEHYVDGKLRDIDIPVHLIWGADDGVVPLSYAEELQREFRDAQLHVIEGAAHIPHIQQPGRFLECLTAIS